MSLQTIADHAQLGAATLFRNFTDKDRLILTAMDQQLRLRVDPVAEAALASDDPRKGFFDILRTIMDVAVTELNMLHALSGTRDVLADINLTVLAALSTLLGRAQAAGTMRADLAPGDIAPMIAMLIAAVELGTAEAPIWPRYMSLLADAVTLQTSHGQLPDAPPIDEFDPARRLSR